MTFREASERAVLVEFASPWESEIHADRVERIHRLVALLDRAQLAGIQELTPAYNSLLVEYDPSQLSCRDLIKHILFCLETIVEIGLTAHKKIEIPVFYGGDYGPDLLWCAERLGMTVSEMVEAHCDAVYRVAFFGFLPGFAYLSGWPAKWSLPRLDSPRTKVPAGSVALAGTQAGIYPMDSPGGWRVLGRTPLSMIEPGKVPFARLELGATIRFYPSSPSAW
ncbi:MAG: 5-oxoprolinase subunit PxpB [Acidobacteriota bacterium]|jgi:inhibitor of KinA